MADKIAHVIYAQTLSENISLRERLFHVFVWVDRRVRAGHLFVNPPRHLGLGEAETE